MSRLRALALLVLFIATAAFAQSPKSGVYRFPIQPDYGFVIYNPCGETIVLSGGEIQDKFQYRVDNDGKVHIVWHTVYKGAFGYGAYSGSLYRVKEVDSQRGISDYFGKGDVFSGVGIMKVTGPQGKEASVKYNWKISFDAVTGEFTIVRSDYRVDCGK